MSDRTKDITGEFVGLDKGTLLYSPIFGIGIGGGYNCSLDKVVEGVRIVVCHNGVKYSFDKDGSFGEDRGRRIFVKPRKNRRNEF